MKSEKKNLIWVKNQQTLYQKVPPSSSEEIIHHDVPIGLRWEGGVVGRPNEVTNLNIHPTHDG